MATSPKAAAHIAFLLGKPPRPGTVFPKLFRLLEHQELKVCLHLPHNAPGPLPDWLLAANLVVQRGLNPEALEMARELEGAGLRLCNRVTATRAVQDRLGVTRTLEAAGLRVPRTDEFSTWLEVRHHTSAQPAVIKARGGARGRGEGVIVVKAGQGPVGAPFAGPYLVQEHLPNDGFDRKLYLAGDQVCGLLKRWPPGAQPAPAAPFAPSPELAELARRAAAALSLDICGIDVIEGPQGPVIVDVNPFPGFRGVPRAAEVIGRCLLTLLP